MKSINIDVVIPKAVAWIYKMRDSYLSGDCSYEHETDLDPFAVQLLLIPALFWLRRVDPWVAIIKLVVILWMFHCAWACASGG